VAFWRSFVYVAKRDPVAAERELRPAYEALRQLGEKSHFSSVSHGLGNALYHQGRLEEAEQMTRECEAACRPNDIHSHVLWRSTRAKVLARRGALAEAEALAREAVELAESSDFHIAHADALMDLAEVLELAGDADGATASADEGRRYFAAKGAAHAAWARGPRELDVHDG
jgi:tetratricopeptide (TPR) repeat protein